MAYTPAFSTQEPGRAELDAQAGPLLIEFGAPWCGHCQAAQPLLAEVLAAYPALPHVKIEDGPGRPLGRSFRVKLWPTLVLLKNGSEIGRLVRPVASRDIAALLAQG